MVERAYDVADHVLSSQATERPTADADLAPRVTRVLLQSVVALVPDIWLADEPGFDKPEDLRAAYVEHLHRRVLAHEGWRP
jgi:hypothetical protein